VKRAIDTIITSNEFSFEMNGSITELITSFEDRSDLEWLRNRIHELRIIDTVRTRLLANWNGWKTRIFIDKQAAYHGKIKFLDDREELPPLGCIELQLEFNDESEFEAFLRYFTPPTKEGRIVN
jgi:predicted RNA binding protein with dsRBD fold (UPF0201 family)